MSFLHGRTNKGLYFILLFSCVSVMMLIRSSGVYAVAETGRTNYKLMNGVTESTVYVTDSGNKNVRVHILRIQKGAEVSLKATYKGYYSKNSNVSTRKKYAKNWDDSCWGYERLKDQAANYESIKNPAGMVIAASNGDFYYKDSSIAGKPIGTLIMEGNVINKSDEEAFFAVLTNGDVDIRYGGSSTSDVTEAVAGSTMLVYDGEIKVDKDDGREPRQAIGVTEDGTVVIVNVDGREPVSAGISLYDLAAILKQQKCVKALNFDGGGSATFLTKRSGDESLVYRNTPGDGFERNVSASLLVIKNDVTSGDEIRGTASVSMKKSNTALSKSSTGQYSYKINGKSQSGFFCINGKTYLFNSKGKGMTKKVKIGDTTYTFKKGALTQSSDKKAGTVSIGYCGASSGGGENLIYAYQKGNKALKVGLNPLYTGKNNGKMETWTSDKGNTLLLPWYSMRSDIKTVYIGDGVKNIGDRFLYVASVKIFDGSEAPTGKLKSVRLPESLTTIGTYAFYNKPVLKNVVIPARVKKIGKFAFGYGGKGYLKFKRSSVPTFGSNVLKKTGYSKIYVKNNAKWKEFVEGGKFIKLGYKKTVSYM